MSFPDPLSRTDEWSALAETVKRDPRAQAGLEAMRRLDTEIRRLARQASTPALSQLRSDFIEEAPAEVFRRLRRFDPAQGTFGAWCFRVLRGEWIDRLRRLRRERLRFTGGVPLAYEPAAEAAPSHPGPLSAADLRRVAGWGPRVRVLLLWLSGLWEFVPGSRWDDWLRASGVGVPFPPSDLQARGTLDARNRLLADALGVKPAALLRCWFRKRQLLRGLDWVDDLLAVS